MTKRQSKITTAQLLRALERVDRPVRSFYDSPLCWFLIAALALFDLWILGYVLTQQTP